MSKSLHKKVVLFTILTGGHGELHASLLPYFPASFSASMSVSSLVPSVSVVDDAILSFFQG